MTFDSSQLVVNMSVSEVKHIKVDLKTNLFTDG